MNRWQIFCIIILTALIPFGGSWALSANEVNNSKDLVMVERSSAEQLQTLKLTAFNNKIPTIILLLIDKQQERLLEKNQIDFERVYRKFTPTADTWFINSADVCSPCFTNVVGSFAKILWKSTTNFLVIAETKNIKYILNNQSGKVAAYNLGPDQTILNPALSDADNIPAK